MSPCFIIILDTFPFCNGVSHISCRDLRSFFALPARPGKKRGPPPGPARRGADAPSPATIGTNTKPPAVPHAAGGLLLGRIFQWTVTSFPRDALGFRLKCSLSVSSNHCVFLDLPSCAKPCFEVPPQTALLTQACLERAKASFHFAFPIAKSFGVCSLPFSWKPVLLSTLVSPFPFCLHCTIISGRCQ